MCRCEGEKIQMNPGVVHHQRCQGLSWASSGYAPCPAEKHYRARHFSGGMVIIRDHVQQVLFVIARLRGRAAEAKECLVYLFAVIRNRNVLLGIRREASAVFIFVFVV